MGRTPRHEALSDPARSVIFRKEVMISLHYEIGSVFAAEKEREREKRTRAHSGCGRNGDLLMSAMLILSC